MASELRVNTLKDAAGNNSVGMSYVAEGTAKAHVRFNGSGTVAISGYSLNVSSVTDLGTGNYEPILTNALAANQGMHMRSSNSYQCWDSSSGAANKMPINTSDASGTLGDTGRCYCSVHGDLA
tara:strand:+ start:324 stop:692 length:369 start_codon:yes stop_codon:yes gene_type:complete